MVASGKRCVERCDLLGGRAFSDMEGGLYRPYLGPAHLKTIGQVQDWMHEAGMSTRLDTAGNLIGRYEGATPNARALIIGSHLDSVRDGGNYDGPLGVLLGVECVSMLSAANIRVPFAIEVYGFGDEEGSRFPASMMCSRAVCGQLALSGIFGIDKDGIGIEEALQAAGLSKDRFLEARRDPAELVGYLEAHIEQGPVLEAEGLALGVVTGIAAQRRYEVMVLGTAGHAGTNSMRLRLDALTAASEMILAIEAVARAGPDDLVATVGKLQVEPGAPNVVPGQVLFTIDVRAGTEPVRDAACDAILEALADVLRTRNVTLRHRIVHDLPASLCDPTLMHILSRAVETTGVTPRRIVSGAGHDAMAFSAMTPTAMLFIRCKNGISHNPLESVTAEDVDLALKAMVECLITIEGNLK